MSNKTNDEKLKVLQERLAQIKLKQDTPSSDIQQEEEAIEITNSDNEESKKSNKASNLSWIKKVVIIGSIAYGIFYSLTNFESLVNNLTSEEVKDQSLPTKLEYKLDLQGKNIAVFSTLNSIKDEGTAKAMVNDLKVKGFKCDYIYLPENSNLTEEVYQIFIGPYESDEETNQWINSPAAKNLPFEFNVVNL